MSGTHKEATIAVISYLLSVKEHIGHMQFLFLVQLSVCIMDGKVGNVEEDVE